MNDMSHLESIASGSLIDTPRFYVEDHRGLQKAPEIQIQAQFLNLLRFNGRGITAFANANAGKRNPFKAKREGIEAGVFDVTVAWEPTRIAFPEFKGWDANGRPGSLSVDQIRWGNAMLALGHDVACFFDPVAAYNWLRGKGCPLRKLEG